MSERLTSLMREVFERDWGDLLVQINNFFAIDMLRKTAQNSAKICTVEERCTTLGTTYNLPTPSLAPYALDIAKFIHDEPMPKTTNVPAYQ